MYDDERSRYRQRSRSRDRDQYRRSSRSPRGRRGGDDSEPDYHRSRKDDPSPGYRRSHHQPYDGSLSYDDDDQRAPRPRSRSRSPRRHYHHNHQQSGPGRPAATIIVEGLPSDATEDDVLDGFASVSPDLRVFNADTVKAVRLRATNKRGNRIGFVEFATVNDAAHFLEYHYPGLEFPLAHSRGVDSEPFAVGINYSRGREDESAGERGRDEVDWKCGLCSFMNYGSRNRCHRCREARPDGYEAASYGPRLTGETDECPQQHPSQYLVIRGLDPSITEELFAEGVKKLYVETKPEPKKETQNKLKSTAPTANTARLGARPDSLRRVFLVRDKQTDEGMRYGFAEFATLEDAQGAIAKFKASPNITISLKPVSIAFIHAGVFIPGTSRITEENSRYVFNPIYNRDIFLKYWDSRVYPSALRVTEDAKTAKRQSADDADSPEKQGGLVGDESTAATDASGKKIKKFKLGPSATKAAPVMGSQMQMWAKKRAELVASKTRADVDDSLESSPAPSERPVIASKRARPKDTYTSFADTEGLSCMLCLRRFTSLLALRDHEALDKEHQANRHNEERRTIAIEKLKVLGKRPRQITIRVVNTSHNPSDRIYTSYADTDNLHCLVCQRKFSSPGMLSLHERESEMHRSNLADQLNIDRAISHLARAGKTPRKMVPAKNKGTQYRDRAKERRAAFKQPNAPRRKAPVTDVADVEPEKAAAPSRGAALLGKMGWAAGEGLGADKAGRTEAIATDVYAAGVGLGAEGARLGDAAEEAAKKTTGDYTDFVEVTRNKARERYEKLG